jgi:micrococcal nuclease
MKKGAIVAGGVAFIVIATALLIFGERDSRQDVIRNESAIVSRVIDLDTLELADGQRVRLLCVDAPEREQPWTSRAEMQFREMVVDKNLTLVRDISDKDKYGRLLRFAYLEDGRSLQAWLVQNGFARLKPYEPDTTHCSSLEAAWAKAAEQGRGIWAAKPPLCEKDIYECDDFATKAQATLLFGTCGGTANDVHKLDADRDGIACEELS